MPPERLRTLVDELVGKIVVRPERCPTHSAAAADCPTLRAVTVKLLAVADNCDARAARIRGAAVPDTTPAAAFVVERNDHAAALMRAAEDIRGALTDTLGRPELDAFLDETAKITGKGPA